MGPKWPREGRGTSHPRRPAQARAAGDGRQRWVVCWRLAAEAPKAGAVHGDEDAEALRRELAGGASKWKCSDTSVGACEFVACNVNEAALGAMLIRAPMCGTLSQGVLPI